MQRFGRCASRVCAAGLVVWVIVASGGAANAAPAPPEVNVIVDPSNNNPPNVQARCAGGFVQIPANFEIQRTGDTTTALSVAYTIDGPATGSPASPVSIPSGQDLFGLDALPTLAAQAGDTITVTLQPGSGYTVGSSASQSRTVVITSEDCHYPVSVPGSTEGLVSIVDCNGDETPALPALVRVTRPQSVLQSVTVAYTFDGVAGSFDFAQANSYRDLEFNVSGHFVLVDGDQYDIGDPSEADVVVAASSLQCTGQLARTGPSRLGPLAGIGVGLVCVGYGLLLAARRRKLLVRGW